MTTLVPSARTRLLQTGLFKIIDANLVVNVEDQILLDNIKLNSFIERKHIFFTRNIIPAVRVFNKELMFLEYNIINNLYLIKIIEEYPINVTKLEPKEDKLGRWSIQNPIVLFEDDSYLVMADGILYRKFV